MHAPYLHAASPCQLLLTRSLGLCTLNTFSRHMQMHALALLEHQRMSSSSALVCNQHERREAGRCVAQIIQVNLTSENPQPIVAGANVEFTYSVKWVPSAITFPRRFERYLDYNFFEHQVGFLIMLLSRPSGDSHLDTPTTLLLRPWYPLLNLQVPLSGFACRQHSRQH